MWWMKEEREGENEVIERGGAKATYIFYSRTLMTCFLLFPLSSLDSQSLTDSAADFCDYPHNPCLWYQITTSLDIIQVWQRHSDVLEKKNSRLKLLCLFLDFHRTAKKTIPIVVLVWPCTTFWKCWRRRQPLVREPTLGWDHKCPDSVAADRIPTRKLQQATQAAFPQPDKAQQCTPPGHYFFYSENLNSSWNF